MLGNSCWSWAACQRSCKRNITGPCGAGEDVLIKTLSREAQWKTEGEGANGSKLGQTESKQHV